MDAVLPLASASFQAILQITFTCLFGFILMRRGLMTKDMHKSLASININFFTPCLLFTKMASRATYETYLSMWPIPVIYFAMFILSSLVASVGAKILRLPKPMKHFVQFTTLFSNSNSLPISLIQSISISSVASYLFWDENDTSAGIEARGTTYIAVFAAVSNIVRWSYGVNLIRSMEDKIESSPTLTPNPEVGMEGEPSETAPLIDADDISVTSIVPEPLPLSGRIRARFNSFKDTCRAVINPPLIAIFAAFFVSAIPPVKSLFYGESPLFSPFTHAIGVCAGAAIPAVLVGLGCNISMLIQDSRRVSFRMVSLVVVSRFVIVPAMGIALLLFARPYFYLGDDPVFVLVMMILIASPTAINLLQVCQSVNKFEEEMSMILLYSYLLAVPVMTGMVTFFLYLIKSIAF